MNSISDSSSVLDKFKGNPSQFMQLWNKSVVESIDFKCELKGVDAKEMDDALNCALYADDVHNHCLKTEGQTHPN